PVGEAPLIAAITRAHFLHRLRFCYDGQRRVSARRHAFTGDLPIATDARHVAMGFNSPKKVALRLKWPVSVVPLLVDLRLCIALSRRGVVSPQHHGATGH